MRVEPLGLSVMPDCEYSQCYSVAPSSLNSHSDGFFVSQTRIEGGAKAVLTSGGLELQRVRVIYARTSLLFWFDVEHQ